MTTAATTAINANPYLTNYINQQNANASSASSSSSSSSTASSGLTGNLNTFLTILTTQLKNQDPTAATDTNQFTQELVEFAGVEQQLNTNTDLSTLINLQQNSSGVNAALSYMGNYVSTTTTNATSATIPLQNGASEFGYTLPSTSTANKVTITITNSSGATVATYSGPTTAGANYVTWNGQNSSGTQLADGTYGVTITAETAAGVAITPTNLMSMGLVTSVESNSNGTNALGLGDSGVSVNTSAVSAVYQANSLPSSTTLTD